MDHIVYGRTSEYLATNYLKKHGYKIIKNNYKNSIGEIDIIAKYKKLIVFVEVKARSSRAFGDPLEAIDENKQFKIRQVAQMYLKTIGKLDCPVRFDAISVLGDDEIYHIENAF